MADDRIGIHGLLLRAVLGVDEHERRDRQDLVLDLELECDLSAAGASDDLAGSVDYRAVTKAVIAHVEGSSYKLAERLAQSTADLVLDGFPGVRAVTVRVEKPGALRFARAASVTLRRTR